MTEERKKVYDKTYMEMAVVLAKLSYCIKKKVGAILVKDNKIIATGFNGSPAKNFPNNCEDETGKTFWHTIHAESNAITSVAASTQTCQGATMYITCSPCKECAKLIYQAGIVRVLYLEFYKDLEGANFLQSAGIEVIQLKGIDPPFVSLQERSKLGYDKVENNKFFFTTLFPDFIEKNRYNALDEQINSFIKDWEIEECRLFLEMTKHCKDKLKNRNKVYAKLLLSLDREGQSFSEISHLQ